MASKVKAYEFVEEVSRDFYCSICLSILQQPQMVNCCEKQFCEHCLSKWKNQDYSCPHCRSVDFTHMRMQTTARKIAALQVYCPNSQQGCKVTLAMQQCKHHIAEDNPKGCLFIKLPCPNACGKIDIFRAAIDQHCTDECPKRPVTCPHCGESGWYLEMTEEHPQKCLLYPLSCPHECGATVVREDLPNHRSNCPLEPMECPFKNAGCAENLLRKDVEEHLSTAMTEHLLQLAKQNFCLKREIVSLDKNQKSLKNNCKELQEKGKATETKLSQVGLLLQDLRRDLGEPEIVSIKMRQLDTVLIDTSVAAIGASISLVLSKTTGQGRHFINVEKIKFELDWIYKTGTLQLELFLAEAEATLDLLSCDFFVKIEPRQEGTQPQLSSSLGKTRNTVSSLRILAVICCGRPQYYLGEAIGATKKSIGPPKTVYINTDATLTLTLKKHERVFMELKRRSVDASLLPANMHTCQCPCHCHPRPMSFPSTPGKRLIRNHSSKKAKQTN